MYPVTVAGETMMQFAEEAYFYLHNMGDQYALKFNITDIIPLPAYLSS